MDNSWRLNTDFLIFNRNGGEIILRNDRDGALLSLSEGEYRLLRFYTEQNDYGHVRKRMPDTDVSENVFQQVISRSRELGLLVRGETSMKRRRQNGLQTMLYYLGNRWVSLLSHLFRRPLTAEFNGNLRFFKCFSIDLEGSWCQTLAQSVRFQKMLPWLYALLCLCLTLLPLLLPQADFAFRGFAMRRIPVFGLFICLFFSIFICLFFHEMGHYLLYKRYGGQTNRMGVALMYVVFPVMYTQIDQVCLWKDRKRRIQVSAAGLLTDFLVALTLLQVICLYPESDFVSLLADCLFFYVVIEMMANLNLLFPGTDAYYILEDLTGQERLFGNAYEASREWWKSVFGKDVSLRQRWQRLMSTGKKTWLQLLYFLFCCLCITGYWAAITLLLTFPLWSNRFLTS